MSDGPVKRSHQLALDNIRRIAETLREERNNLTVLVQEQREVLSEAIELLKTVEVSPEFCEKVDKLKLERALHLWVSAKLC